MQTPEHPSGAFVCVGSDESSQDWRDGRLNGLDTRRLPAFGTDPAEDESALRAWVDEAASSIGQRSPVHLIATGSAAKAALHLAVDHPGLLWSLVLGDPDVNPEDPRLVSLLRRVRTPTLVIASLPDHQPDEAIAAAQTIAGFVDNGVFVVVDGCAVPAHRERVNSFDEWALSFAAIAEGLDLPAANISADQKI